MRVKLWISGIAPLLVGMMNLQATAAELEISHWWTSGGESAAVRTLATAFEKGGDTWIDNAIAGGGEVSRSVILTRIQGGDPMGAMQFNHGRQVEDLVEAGLMLDLTEVAERENWREIIRPASLLDSCTVDGRVYCSPVNIHSWQWMWLNVDVYESLNIPVPANWYEFVESAKVLQSANIIPLATGSQPWQILGIFNVLLASIGGVETWNHVYEKHDRESLSGDKVVQVWQAFDIARQLSDPANVQTNWSEATYQVMGGSAAAQIIGDWAQGEFVYAGKKAGEDYECLPGLGVSPILDTAGDAFYFPKLDDEEKTQAQLRLASLIVSPQVQLGFNLAKGSLPVRDDIDLGTASACMQKGLDILNKGDNVIRSYSQLISNDTEGELNDLVAEFWSDTSISASVAHARFVQIMKQAD